MPSKQEKLAVAQERMRQRHGPAPEARVSVESPLPIEQEKHFRPTEVAEMLGWSVWTVRRRFANLPGVPRRDSGGRRYMTIPARVLKAYHEKLTTKQ
jgi:hypothetical protein